MAENKLTLRVKIWATILVIMILLASIYMTYLFIRILPSFSLFSFVGSIVIICVAIYWLAKVWIDNILIFNSNEFIITMALSLIVLAYPFAYTILNLGRSLAESAGTAIGTSDGWLGFTGSLISGVITLLAMLSIFQSKKDEIKKEDKPKQRVIIRNSASYRARNKYFKRK